jgi:hypothetical protein
MLPSVSALHVAAAQEWYKIADDPPVSSSSISNGASSSDTHSHSASAASSSHKQGSSSKLHVPSKPPALSDWQRSLQAYLSLPLEQYRCGLALNMLL